MGERWGWVDLKENGEINEICGPKYNKVKNTDELPDWVKTKMAMLDLMVKGLDMPCGSYWNMAVNDEYENPLEPLKTYFIYED